MFKRDVQSLKNVLLRNLREQGLETPLMQKRLVDSWPEVAGPVIARYTLNTYIYNQTLYVRLSNPSLRTGYYRCALWLTDHIIHCNVVCISRNAIYLLPREAHPNLISL